METDNWLAAKLEETQSKLSFYFLVKADSPTSQSGVRWEIRKLLSVITEDNAKAGGSEISLLYSFYRDPLRSELL